MSINPKHVTVRLRVPPELRDKIATSSEQYNRSMNADMVARLEESFNKARTTEYEIDDLKTLLQQSMDTNKKYFQMITELISKEDASKKAP